MDGREAESAGDGNKLDPIDRDVGGEVDQGDDSDAREDEHKEGDEHQHVLHTRAPDSNVLHREVRNQEDKH